MKRKSLGTPDLEYCSEFESRSQFVNGKQIKKLTNKLGTNICQINNDNKKVKSEPCFQSFKT